MNGVERRRVLFVDDDASVVDGLRKALYKYRQRWDVRTTTEAREAVALLASEPFDALVTDMRMPQMDGEALLREAAARWPAVLRMVLSGEVGEANLSRVYALAHQFVPKPVTTVALYGRIEEALEARDKLANPALKDLVCRLGTLPSLPGTFGAINALAERPDSTLEDFVAVVENDPAVCGSVLRVVNSAWFGLRVRVGSIREAVRLLGTRPLRNVVLATEVFGAGGAAIELLRRQALERLGVLGRLLPLLQAGALKEEAATALVLVDVGQLVVTVRAPDEATRIADAVLAGRQRVPTEREVLGADHALLGGVLLSLWSLPPALVDAVALHEDARVGQAAVAPSLASLVALVCRLQETRDAQPHERPPLLAEATVLAQAFGVEALEPLRALFDQRVED